MNLEIWILGLALPVLIGITWAAARWWYLRHLRAMQRKLSSLNGTHQATLNLVTQTRQQIEDLKGIVTEYRRRLTTAQVSHRLSRPVAPQAAAEEETTSESQRGRVVWADTLPL